MYRAALRLNPRLPQLHKNLALALAQQGQIDQAVAAHRQAVELRPGHPGALSNLIYALLFQPGTDPGVTSTEYERWNARFSRPRRNPGQTYPNDLTLGRRLRIGYVSPDFCEHVVGRNLVLLFREHDKNGFEIFCYSRAVTPDNRTGMLRSSVDHWRVTVGTTDEELANMIHQDRIDILVDLTEHMAANRLPVFARAPAPVQVSFAGYPESLGWKPLVIASAIGMWNRRSKVEDRRSAPICDLLTPISDLRSRSSSSIVFGVTTRAAWISPSLNCLLSPKAA